MGEKRWHRPSLVWPAILVFAGGVLLLGNLGLLRVNWWDLWQLWPIVLILAGLDLLVRHSRWGSAAMAVLMLALLGGLFYVMVTGPWPGRTLGLASSANAVRVAREVSQELAGAKQADVSIRLGAGELRVAALNDSPYLLEGALSYPDGWQAPDLSYQVTNDLGRLDLRSRGTRSWVIPFGRPLRGETWHVGLTREVPLSISVDAGASRSELDLRHLQLKDLRVKAGVGQMEIYFPSEGADMVADIDGGVGELTLRIPESVAARIVVDGGLGSVKVAQRFERMGDHSYQTPGYGTAANRLDVRVDAGIGELRVQ